MAITKIPAAGFTGNNFRNIIINGDMSIAQRSTSVASITTAGYYTLDRWNIGASSLGTFTMSKSTDVPSGYGFANSLKLDCTTADASPDAGDYMQLNQIFEGQNLQYLKKGTASASSLTLSFWVKSTKTGTFIAELIDLDNSRGISKSYTVNVTDTWEKKTVTFEGDTTGALANDNGSSLVLSFWLGAGSTYSSGTLATTWGSITNANRVVGQVNIADSTSNDWYITGVQLEAGTTASDFEFLPVDVNLQRCRRYYQIIASGAENLADVICTASAYDTVTAYGVINLSPIMRAKPSIVQVAGSNFYRFHVATAVQTFDSFNLDSNNSSLRNIRISNADNMSFSSGNSGWFQISDQATGYLAVNAEM
jgi:hypothetical protein